MLVIHAEGKYNDYSRKNMKPSEYVKQYLRLGNIKSYRFAKDYFSDPNKLVQAIWEHQRKTSNKKSTLADLLK